MGSPFASQTEVSCGYHRILQLEVRLRRQCHVHAVCQGRGQASKDPRLSAVLQGSDSGGSKGDRRLSVCHSRPAGPYLSGSTEWKARLSEELTYEYEEEAKGPLVEAFRVKSGDRKSLPDKEQTPRLYVRLVAAKIKQGKTKELEERYQEEILPALQSVEGFRGGFLVEGFQNPGNCVSITIWDREEDAIRYELSGLFEELAGKVSDLLSSTHQWRMSLTSTARADKAVSDDLTVTGYHVVAGNKM